MFRTHVISFIVLVFFAGVSCSTLSRSHRDPQSAGRVVGEGAKEVGEFIGGLLKKAEAGSPNKPVRELITGMGFDIDDVPKPVIDKIKKTNALENPMNYFGSQHMNYSDSYDEFKRVFDSQDGSKELPFLRKFVAQRLNLDDEDHISVFLFVFEGYLRHNGRSVNLAHAKGVFDEMMKHMEYGDQRVGDLLAVSIRNKTDHEASIIASIARTKMFSVLSSSYFKDIDDIKHIAYDLLIEGINDVLVDIVRTQPLPNLWKQAHAISDKDGAKALNLFKSKVRTAVRTTLGETSDPDKMAKAFEETTQLRTLANFAREDQSFSDFLQEIMSELL